MLALTSRMHDIELAYSTPVGSASGRKRKCVTPGRLALSSCLVHACVRRVRRCRLLISLLRMFRSTIALD